MSRKKERVPERRIPGRCPICGGPRVHRYRPFCSARCRDRDLLNWLDGRYRVPVVEREENSSSEPEG